MARYSPLSFFPFFVVVGVFAAGANTENVSLRGNKSECVCVYTVALYRVVRWNRKKEGITLAPKMVDDLISSRLLRTFAKL